MTQRRRTQPQALEQLLHKTQNSQSGSPMGQLLQRAEGLLQLQTIIQKHLPEHLAQHCLVGGFHGKQLVLVTPTASVASSLRFQTDHIIEILHRNGLDGIQRIDIKVGPMKHLEEIQKSRRPLSKAAQESLQRYAEDFGDRELLSKLKGQ